MAFANTILPDVPLADMRGLHLLLDLIANPARAKEAQELLEKLTTMRDEAQDKLDAAEQAKRDADSKLTVHEARVREVDLREQAAKRLHADAAALKEKYTARLAQIQGWAKGD